MTLSTVRVSLLGLYGISKYNLLSKKQIFFNFQVFYLIETTEGCNTSVRKCSCIHSSNLGCIGYCDCLLLGPFPASLVCQTDSPCDPCMAGASDGVVQVLQEEKRYSSVLTTHVRTIALDNCEDISPSIMNRWWEETQIILTKTVTIVWVSLTEINIFCIFKPTCTLGQTSTNAWKPCRKWREDGVLCRRQPRQHGTE